MSTCQSWCVDHRREFVGPEGECHSEVWESRDSCDLPAVTGNLLKYDEDDEASFFITVAGKEGEHLVGISLEAMEAIADALVLYPQQTRDIFAVACQRANSSVQS